MTAIGMGLVWFGYWWGISGYSLVRGYNNSPLQLANPLHLATWTTQCYTGPNIFPTGDPKDSGACAGAPPVKTQVGVINAGPGGKCPAGFTYNKKTRKCDRIPTPALGH